MIPRLGDHRPTVGVPDKNDGFALRVDGALRDGNVVGVRDRRMLNNADAIAVVRQVLVDSLPAGAVHESAVDKDDRGGVRLAHEELLSS